MFTRIPAFIVLLSFLINTLIPMPCATAGVVDLPKPGAMVSLSAPFQPMMIKGLTVNKDNPFLFDFIVDSGESTAKGEAFKSEADRLIKYFFASLTVPEKDIWVNLSPYEKDRMVPNALGKTDLGRDLLAQDYILKQLTASLIYPEKDLGKKFWDSVYAKARQIYGNEVQVPVNTFNKVWIVADKARVYEHNQTAWIVDSNLKVMLEEDYLALTKQQKSSTTNNLSSQLIRDIVIPEIEKEVNTGKNFAQLRQIFNSIILATWYKKTLKEALLTQAYADKNTVNGIDTNTAQNNQEIYNQYIQAYKKGVFNLIKEEKDSITQETHPRKYFSGGFNVNETMLSKSSPEAAQASFAQISQLTRVSALASEGDSAMFAKKRSPADEVVFYMGTEKAQQIIEESKLISLERLEQFAGRVYKVGELLIADLGRERVRQLSKNGRFDNDDTYPTAGEYGFMTLAREVIIFTKGGFHQAIAELIEKDKIHAKRLLEDMMNPAMTTNYEVIWGGREYYGEELESLLGKLNRLKEKFDTAKIKYEDYHKKTTLSIPMDYARNGERPEIKEYEPRFLEGKSYTEGENYLEFYEYGDKDTARRFLQNIKRDFLNEINADILHVKRLLRMKRAEDSNAAMTVNTPSVSWAGTTYKEYEQLVVDMKSLKAEVEATRPAYVDANDEYAFLNIPTQRDAFFVASEYSGIPFSKNYSTQGLSIQVTFETGVQDAKSKVWQHRQDLIKKIQADIERVKRLAEQVRSLGNDVDPIEEDSAVKEIRFANGTTLHPSAPDFKENLRQLNDLIWIMFGRVSVGQIRHGERTLLWLASFLGDSVLTEALLSELKAVEPDITIDNGIAWLDLTSADNTEKMHQKVGNIRRRLVELRTVTYKMLETMNAAMTTNTRVTWGGKEYKGENLGILFTALKKLESALEEAKKTTLTSNVRIMEITNAIGIGVEEVRAVRVEYKDLLSKYGVEWTDDAEAGAFLTMETPAKDKNGEMNLQLAKAKLLGAVKAHIQQVDQIIPRELKANSAMTSKKKNPKAKSSEIRPKNINEAPYSVDGRSVLISHDLITIPKRVGGLDIEVTVNILDDAGLRQEVYRGPMLNAKYIHQNDLKGDEENIRAVVKNDLKNAWAYLEKAEEEIEQLNENNPLRDQVEVDWAKASDFAMIVGSEGKKPTLQELYEIKSLIESTTQNDVVWKLVPFAGWAHLEFEMPSYYKQFFSNGALKETLDKSKAKLVLDDTQRLRIEYNTAYVEEAKEQLWRVRNDLISQIREEIRMVQAAEAIQNSGLVTFEYWQSLLNALQGRRHVIENIDQLLIDWEKNGGVRSAYKAGTDLPSVPRDEIYFTYASLDGQYLEIIINTDGLTKLMGDMLTIGKKEEAERLIGLLQKETQRGPRELTKDRAMLNKPEEITSFEQIHTLREAKKKYPLGTLVSVRGYKGRFRVENWVRHNKQIFITIDKGEGSVESFPISEISKAAKSSPLILKAELNAKRASLKSPNVKISEVPIRGGNQVKDRAMSQIKSSPTGGIDLSNAANGMTFEKDANGGVKITVDPAMIERIKREGIKSIVPTIIQMTPINLVDIRPLLGFASDKESKLAKV